MNELFKPEQQAVDKVIQLPELEQDKLATVVVDEDLVTSSDQAERAELLALVDELSVSQPVEINAPNEVPADETSAVEKASEVEEKPELDSKPELEDMSTEIESVDEHQQDWIMQQQGTDYTFQLMGSWEHQDVSKFIEKYALTGDVAEFESLRNGRVWYALIYGVYDSKQAALEASNVWPAPLNTLPSWLRRFDSIQKQLTKKAQAQ